MNSFLKWARSKRKLLPQLLASVPAAFDRYVEPFAGSACLFFRLQPTRAILADINKDLIETYRQLRENVEDVIVALTHLRCTEVDYYAVRAAKPSNMCGPARAAWFTTLIVFALTAYIAPIARVCSMCRLAGKAEANYHPPGRCETAHWP